MPHAGVQQRGVISPESLGSEFGRAGLEINSTLGDVTGRPFDPQSTEFAVIARLRPS